MICAPSHSVLGGLPPVVPVRAEVPELIDGHGSPSAGEQITAERTESASQWPPANGFFFKTLRPIYRLEFPGPIGNKQFSGITVNEFSAALRLNGWREAHRGHVFQTLVERGRQFGILTLNHFAHALRSGFTQPAEQEACCRVCCDRSCWVIFKGNEFITLRHPEERSFEGNGHGH